MENDAGIDDQRQFGHSVGECLIAFFSAVIHLLLGVVHKEPAGHDGHNHRHQCQQAAHIRRHNTRQQEANCGKQQAHRNTLGPNDPGIVLCVFSGIQQFCVLAQLGGDLLRNPTDFHFLQNHAHTVDGGQRKIAAAEHMEHLMVFLALHQEDDEDDRQNRSDDQTNQTHINHPISIILRPQK